MEKVKTFFRSFLSSPNCNNKKREKLIIDYWNARGKREKQKELCEEMVKCIVSFSKDPRNSRFGAYEDKTDEEHERLLVMAKAAFDTYSPEKLDEKIKELEEMKSTINKEPRRKRTPAENKRLEKLRRTRDELEESRKKYRSKTKIEEETELRRLKSLEDMIQGLEEIEISIANRKGKQGRTKEEDEKLERYRRMRKKMKDETLSQMNSWNVEEKLKF